MALINQLKVTLISFGHNAICKRLFYLNTLKKLAEKITAK